MSTWVLADWIISSAISWTSCVCNGAGMGSDQAGPLSVDPRGLGVGLERAARASGRPGPVEHRSNGDCRGRATACKAGLARRSAVVVHEAVALSRSLARPVAWAGGGCLISASLAKVRVQRHGQRRDVRSIEERQMVSRDRVDFDPFGGKISPAQ